MLRKVTQSLLAIALMTGVVALINMNLSTPRFTQNEFTLDTNCPRGFLLVSGNSCELRSRYQLYTSAYKSGVDPTPSNLPEHRDGFSPQQIDLGRLLFFDPILSGDQRLSCASCHQPDKGFADGKARSTGANGKTSRRSAPTLWNSAFSTSFFWDARARNLEEQALGPLYAAGEMNNTPTKLLVSLRSNTHYQRLFKEAFNKRSGFNENQQSAENSDINIDNIVMALAAFQTSLISLNSRYDEYAHGSHDALSENEIAGMKIFHSFAARCSECHIPPLFTNNEIAVIGVPEESGNEFDIGAEQTFGLAKLRGGFKVPTLRNIAKTAPYMHSGNFKTLRETTEFYNKGRGHAVPQDLELAIHWHINEPGLNDRELDLIVMFLKTLSDEKFKPEIPTKVPSGLRY